VAVDHVFALDFDGVLCDSAAETAESAWRAGRGIWAEWRDQDAPPALVDRFCRLRPVIETGYQTIALMRLCDSDVSDEDVLSRFGELCDRVLADAGLTRQQSVELFGRTRDDWIRANPDGWLGKHRFYPGTIETVRAVSATSPVYILTTKQERFVHALLRGARCELPAGQVFGLDSGKKKEDVLAQLLRGPQLVGATVHFVEDRLDTLRRVMARPDLDAVRLYLAAWGYNLPAERDEASHVQRVTLWDLQQFLRVA